VGDAGVLVAPDDAAALAAAVTRVLGDATLRSWMAQQGARRLREQYSLDSAVSGLRDVYEVALRQRRTSRTSR
jgi:glycosyltransferase involved in cell wall biosynthesis